MQAHDIDLADGFRAAVRRDRAIEHGAGLLLRSFGQGFHVRGRGARGYGKQGDGDGGAQHGGSPFQDALTLGDTCAADQRGCASPLAAVGSPCDHAAMSLLSALLAAAVAIPAGVATHADGRAPVESLYRASLALVERGWTAELIAESAPAGTAQPLPIIALTSPGKGPAVWILTGVHGEEPAGPNAVAAAIDDIARLGASRPSCCCRS